MESDRSWRQRAVRISGLRKCSDHRDSWHAAAPVLVNRRSQYRLFAGIECVAARRSSAWRLDTELFMTRGVTEAVKRVRL